MEKNQDFHKEHEHAKQKHKIKINKWQISAVILGILLIISILTAGFSKIGSADLAEKTVVDKTIKFINQNLLQGQGKAVLKSVEESADLYKLKLDINGQELDSYVTKNGELLFPKAINMDETPETPEQPQAQDIPQTDIPDVKLFTMTFCPYGNQAEDAMHPVVEALKDNIEVEPHYVIYSNYRGGGPQYCLDDENKYCSMHGIQELNQDVRELCV